MLGFTQTWNLTEFSKSNILPSNFINDFGQDINGGILFASDIGLYRYNGLSVSKIQGNYFYKIVRTNKDKIYAVTNTNVVHVFENLILIDSIVPSTDEPIVDFSAVYDEEYLITKSNLFCYSNRAIVKQLNLNKAKKIFIDKRGIPLILDSDGVLMYNNGLLSVIYPSIEEKIIDITGAQDEIYCISKNHLFRFSNGKNSLELYSKEEISNGLLIRSVKELGQVILQRDRVLILPFDSDAEVVTNAQFFSHGYHAMFVDDFGGIWFSEKGKGIVNIPNPEIQRYFLDSKVSVVSKWNDYTVFGTKTGLILKNSFDEFSNKFYKLDVFDLKVLEDGLLMSTQKGLYKIDDTFDTTCITREVYNKIEYSPKNEIIYGVSKSEGLKVYDFKIGEFVHLGIKDGMSHNIITDFVLKDDTLLIATPAGGLNVVVGKKVVEDHRFKFKTRVIVNSLFYSKIKDELYCSTPNSGIYTKSMKNGDSWFNFNHSVYAIFEFESNIWITHDAGLDVVNDEYQTQQIFQPNNPSEFLPFANGMFSNKEEVYLGINEGYLRVKPKKDYFTQTIPFSIQRIILNDKLIPLDSILDIANGKHRLKVVLDYVNLYSPNNEALEWRMSNYSEEWTPVKKSEIEFPILRSGEYKLEIRLKGENVSEPSVISIYIDKPFWLKLWFYIVLLLSFSILLYLYSVYRTKALKADKIKLEKLVDRRTLQLKNKNEELKQFAYVVSHDFKNPVVNITALADLLSNSELNNDKKHEIVNHIKMSSSALYTQLLGMLELLKLDELEVPVEPINLNDIFKTIELSLESQIKTASASILFDDEDFIISSNKSYIHSVLYNLISNAIKYSHPDRNPIVKIERRYANNKLIISVKDNGLGLDLKNNGEELFQPFRRIHTQNEGSGLGLALVKRMVNTLNGEITVESEPNVGSTFSVTFSSHTTFN